MNKSLAKETIKNVFSNEFERSNFINFTNHLLHDAKFESYTVQGSEIPDQYKDHIHSLERLASYNDVNGKAIDLLIVTLKKDTALERARTMQRNFVARYLTNERKDASLVAFVCPGFPYWRFSLIKMELSIVGVDVEASFTPAKRWSFLVGKNEGSHTAQSQLVGILTEAQQAPSITDLEEAFSIETVTNEFFAKYTDLFLRMKESLDELLESDSMLNMEFNDKEIDTSDFAKKTMGQISFLYFLQKKGWFGVAPGKEWGTGRKRFLREVFERRDKYGSNFFDDILEPLFYKALAQDRGNDAIYPELNNCRMPFLNGGLFEPMNNYSWETTHILLPDELFSNKTNTYEGDGIFDVFDLYNFTVNESDPLDQEVAVDPEMLGKVFENLLEIKDRKSKGAFYTPREIVHYMCQESLIHYLDKEVDSQIPVSDLKLFITQSSQISQNDRSIFEQNLDQNAILLPQSIRSHKEELDHLLANIKVCDPAVGSGAFPLGMLNEIVSARTLLAIHIGTSTSAYQLKLHAISNSIYGVDLDPGAVEIAKLRFWLSLVVEEDFPSPLPNLEHKIMQGDSLISQYAGIELFNDEFLDIHNSAQIEIEDIKNILADIQKEANQLLSAGEFNSAKKQDIDNKVKSYTRRLKFLKNKIVDQSESGSLFDIPEAKEEAQKKTKQLQSKVAEYISVVSKTQKENLKNEIETLKWDLIEASLEEEDEVHKLESIRKLRKDRIKPFFIWKLEFSEVFKNKNGFDIVIGNPPYLRVQGIEKDISKTYKELYRAATGSYDLYVLFTEKGLDLIGKNGVLNYIMPHKWVNSAFGKGLRELSKNSVKKLISFEAYQVFNASTYTSLVWFNKNHVSELNYIGLEKDLNTNRDLEKYLLSISKKDFTVINKEQLSADMWVLTNKQIKAVLDKMNQQPLRVSDIFEKIFQGIATSKDSVYFLTDVKEKEQLLECYSKELDKRILVEKELAKPLLKGDSVHRYEEIQTNRVVIFPYYISKSAELEQAVLYKEDYLETNFPHGYSYLKECEDILRSREKGRFNIEGEWFQFGRKQGILGASKEKIITPYLSMKSQLSYDRYGDYYANTKCFGLIKNKNVKESYAFYLSILNSNLMWFFIRSTSSVMSGNYYTYTKDSLSPFPIPKIENLEYTRPFENLVEHVMKNKKLNVDTQDLESEIDQLVYKLYGLTDKEIEIVENSS